MVILLKIKRRAFFSTRQHSYFGVTLCENSEVLITVFSKRVLVNGNLYKDLLFVFLQPSANKNS